MNRVAILGVENNGFALKAFTKRGEGCDWPGRQRSTDVCQAGTERVKGYSRCSIKMPQKTILRCGFVFPRELSKDSYHAIVMG